MNFPQFGLLVFALSILAGCSSDSGPDWADIKGEAGPARLIEFTPSVKFEERWKAALGDSNFNVLTPALSGGVVYGASAKGALFSMNGTSGEQIWKIDTGVAISGGVGSGDGLVLIGSDKGEVIAFDENGKQRWKATVSSEVLSAPQVADGLVLVRSGDGRIAALNASDGKQQWLYERSTPALVVRNHAGLAIQRGIAYAGFAGGKLVALKISDGSVLWEVAVSIPRGNTELERISDITSSPVVDDEVVCAIAFQGRLACFDPLRGNPLWNREISSDKGMLLLRSYLYLSDARGSVMMLDKATGSTVWKNDKLSLRSTSTPQVLGDLVLVGDYAGYLHALNREDGSMAARTKLEGGAIRSSPIKLDGGLLVQTRDGSLYSLLVK